MHKNSLPPTDRDEQLEEKKTVTTHPCDTAIRSQLLALRENEDWSINDIAKKCNVNTAVVSQYLHVQGCVYPGNVAGFEKKALDMLRNEARRRAYGVETTECAAVKEMRASLEEIRKTNDAGAIVAESGDGKSRGIEPYALDNPTCVLANVCMWHRHESYVSGVFFAAAPQGDWDNQTNRMDYAAKKMLGTDRLFIFDNAHKLPLRSLQVIMDFHDETKCPIALVGTPALVDLLKKDPQLHSRIGLYSLIGQARSKELLVHIIHSLVPKVGGEMDELMALCEQVAAKPGHFRAVHKQLKLAVELRESSSKINTWCLAFRAAHTKMLRDYKLT